MHESLFPLKDTEEERGAPLSLPPLHASVLPELPHSLVFTENAHPIGQTRRLFHLEGGGGLLILYLLPSRMVRHSCLFHVVLRIFIRAFFSVTVKHLM